MEPATLYQKSLFRLANDPLNIALSVKLVYLFIQFKKSFKLLPYS